MIAADIVNQAHRAGVALEVMAGKLLYSPPNPSNGHLLARLAQHKPEIMAFLSRRSHIHPNYDRRPLLAWAARMVEEGLSLKVPIYFAHTEKKMVATSQAARYAGHYLRVLTLSHLQLQDTNTRRWASDWWRHRGKDALAALAALKEAVDAAGTRID